DGRRVPRLVTDVADPPPPGPHRAVPSRRPRDVNDEDLHVVLPERLGRGETKPDDETRRARAASTTMWLRVALRSARKRRLTSRGRSIGGVRPPPPITGCCCLTKLFARLATSMPPYSVRDQPRGPVDAAPDGGRRGCPATSLVRARHLGRLRGGSWAVDDADAADGTDDAWDWAVVSGGRRRWAFQDQNFAHARRPANQPSQKKEEVRGKSTLHHNISE
ncbi:hypothetical protein THAOC_36537, partial [Thalassiosira oceanica]